MASRGLRVPWVAFDDESCARRALGELRSATRPEVEVPTVAGDYKMVRITVVGVERED